MDELSRILQKHQSEFQKIVAFNPAKDKLYRFDFTETNTELLDSDIADTAKFASYIEHKLKTAGAKYGIGGYNEQRILYKRSNLFDGTQPRSVHLGMDIWGAEGTVIYAPLGGTVHSFANNKKASDYGATIILQHQLDTKVFFTLYGHLSLNDLLPLKEGKYISRGEIIGRFGKLEDNGNWPPHLHIQVIEDMRIMKGDYPGVSSLADREKYIRNCPDPDLIVQMMKYCS